MKLPYVLYTSICTSSRQSVTYTHTCLSPSTLTYHLEAVVAVSRVDVQAVSQQLAGAVTLLEAAVEAVPAHAVAKETAARLVRQVDAAWQRVAGINKYTHTTCT